MGNRISLRGCSFQIEEENFFKLGSAIVGIGTDILRQILEFFVLANDIAAKVATYPYLKLHKDQKKLITQAATTGYKTFDVSLCYTLLRNVCTNLGDPSKADLQNPTRGWGKQPLTTDQSVSDDIERIRILRNEMYGHLPNASIPIIQFTETWGQFKDICTRMKIHFKKDFLSDFSKLNSCKVTKAEWSSVVDMVNKSKEHDKELEDHLRRIRRLEIQHQGLETQQKQICQTIQQVQTEQQRLQKNQVTTDRDLQQIHIRQNTLQIRQDTLDETLNEKYERLENRQMGLDTQQQATEEHIDELFSKQQRFQTEQSNVKLSLNTLRTTQRDILSQQGAIDDNLKNSLYRFQRHQDRFDQNLEYMEACHLQIRSNQDSMADTLQEQGNEISSLDTSVQKYARDIDEIRKQITTGQSVTDEEQNISLLKKKLFEILDRETLVIPVAPLQESDKLPIELLYASVVISQDPRYTSKKIKLSRKDQKGFKARSVQSPNDMFIIDGNR